MQLYTLDLPTLLQILARQKHSGTLLSRGVHLRGFKQTMTIRIEIVEGRMSSCVIVDSQNRVLADGSKAYQTIVNSGQLDWQWHAMPPSRPSQPGIQLSPSLGPLSPMPFSPSSGPFSRERGDDAIVPSRATNIHPAVLSQLPRQQKRVLQMVDGVRSKEKIASLLLIENEELTNILHELQQQGLIVLNRSLY